MTDNKNLNIWKQLETTSPDHLTKFDNGIFKGRAINPTYCIKRMTECFGAIGDGWKYEITQEKPVHFEDGQILLYIQIAIHVKSGKEWSNPVYGWGGDFIARKNQKGFMRLDDEAYKKATTDALMNAMKYFGMSADVHMGLWDDNKYVTETTQKFNDAKVYNSPEYKAISKELKELCADLCAVDDSASFDVLKKQAKVIYPKLSEGDKNLLKDNIDNNQARLDMLEAQQHHEASYEG